MVELTKDTYQAAIDATKGGNPMIMDFWGPRCTHCLALKPCVEKYAAEVADKVDLCEVNISGNRRVAMAFRVMSLPTLLFFKDGAEVPELRLSGEAASLEAIKANVAKISA